MRQRSTGTYHLTTVAGEKVRAFVPAALPPSRPPLVLDGQVMDGVRRAEGALARLNMAAEMLPSLEWFVDAYVRKEAVLSSQIEGTQATLKDLLTFEAKEDGAEPDADLEEVCNYLNALAFARTELADAKGLPLSIRLLNGMHSRLMRGVRGAEKGPGEVRRSQNWVGGSRPGNAVFVPPPPEKLSELLADLEAYLHREDGLPSIVRAGLVHVQFETIHPYLDGNGRLGRLLVTLLLEHWSLLAHPLLYLSLHFKRHRGEYYRRLDLVRTEGDWEGWNEFFLDGVERVAEEAIGSVREIFTLVSEDRSLVLESQRTSVAAARLFERLPRNPIVSVGFVTEALDVTKPTAGRAIDALVEAGVLFETTGRRRDRSWTYQRYLDLLRVGTELENG